MSDVVKLGRRQLANRVAWVRDLLSGEYKQSHSRLKIVKDGVASHCCLGVACERLAPKSFNLEIRFILGSGPSNGSFMADKTARKLGLDYEQQTRAAEWNDSNEYSFARIADLVAYATNNRMNFEILVVEDVPQGYALTWLEQYS